MAESTAVCLSNGDVEMRYYQGRAGTGIRIFEARTATDRNWRVARA